MGTRSRIAIQNDDKTFTSVYCHWDGYPGYVGKVLAEHYTDPAKIATLMSLGDMSSIGTEIGEKHSFDARGKRNECTFFGRDRGEDGCEAQASKDINLLRLLTQNCGGEYLYVWQDGAWHIAAGGIAFLDKAPAALVPLADVLKKEAAEA